MIDPVHHAYLLEIERADPVEACHVHPKLIGIRAPLVVRVDATVRAEEMLRRACIEPITGQGLLAFNDF
jgi:hypothetical protein